MRRTHVGIVCVLVIFRPTITKMRWLTWWRKYSNYTIAADSRLPHIVGPDDNSAMRNRMRAACEHFIDVARDPDDVIAARIRADELDILIDLKGYTMGARPSVLARRPCAIQVNWLGYPGTMGAEFIDYLIADSFIVPPGQESNYAERVLRMPHCYQPNDRKRLFGETLKRSEVRAARRRVCILLLQPVIQDHTGRIRGLDASFAQRYGQAFCGCSKTTVSPMRISKLPRRQAESIRHV